MKKLIIVSLVIFLAVLAGLGVYFLNNDSSQSEDKLNGQEDGLYTDLIKVDNPKPNQVIQSPFTVTGQAVGPWYFEASFPIRLEDLSGNLIDQAIATAQGEWMTNEFVPFTSVLDFDISSTTKNAILILHNDNPSGLPENDKEIRIAVVLQKPIASQRPVKLYYYNPNLDKDASGNILCSSKGLVAVDRQIPITQTPIQDAIKLLLKGELSSQERAQGITTEYPLEGFGLEAASQNNGVLTLTFKDLNNKTVGGSCRVGVLWAQIEATAKQFPGVNQVKFAPEELFQP